MNTRVRSSRKKRRDNGDQAAPQEQPQYEIYYEGISSMDSEDFRARSPQSCDYEELDEYYFDD